MSQNSPVGGLHPKPVVSIVLPTYNQCQYLAQCIQSIFAQTFNNFELIIVNDGSTDQTEKLLSCLNDSRIRVITQTNQGLPAALNAGFAEASGQYWTWTSTDNTVSPLWLEELTNALHQAPKDIGYAFSHYAGIDDSGAILFVNKSLRFDIPSLLFRHSGNASFLYRASLAKRVGPYDTTLMFAEDLDMWVRMAAHTRAILVPSVLYYYRLHSSSMTVQQNRVKEATRSVVLKYLSDNDGQF